MDGNSLGTVQYGSKISGRSFIGMAVAILDASFQAGVIVQIYYGGMFSFYLQRYTYQSSSAEMVSYSVFRSLFLFLISFLTIVDSTEYPKRFRELNHFVLVTNGLLAISVMAKILVYYGSASFVSWLFWENCAISIFFSILNPITWRYVSNIDRILEKKRRKVDQDRRVSMDRTLTLLDGGSFADSVRSSLHDTRSAKIEKLLRKQEKKSLFKARKLIWLSWTDTFLFVIGFLCSVLSGITEVFIPYCQAKIVNSVVRINLDTPDRLSYFNQFVLYVGLLMLGKSVFILLQSSFLLRAKDRLEFKIQSVMFNKILQEKQQFFDKRSNESMMQRMTGDVESFATIVTESCTTFIRSIVKSTIVFLFLLFAISWELSLVMLCAVPVLIYITINYTYKVNRLREEIDDNIDDAFEHVSECFRKIKTLKQFRTETYESKNFTARLKKIDNHKRMLSYRIGLFKGSLSFIQVGLLFSILLFGGHLVMNHLINGEDFLIFLFMHPDMIEGIDEIGRTFTEIIQTYLWAVRLLDTMKKLYDNDQERRKAEQENDKDHSKPKKRKGGKKGRGGGSGNSGGDNLLLPNNTLNFQRGAMGPYRPQEVRGGIIFENVLFSYRKPKKSAAAAKAQSQQPNLPQLQNEKETSVKEPSAEGTNVLNGISFTVEPGQVVALVGKSGCGKSTCLRLLSRMYEITQGRILLDGRSIDAYDTGFFHRQVVHVSSEIELLSRTIKENVQYGIMGANAIDLMKEAEGNKAHPYLEEFYDHWEDTKVAHKISANKEHKLLLGRALIRRPQVVLIDEVAMRLDAEMEELFERQLLRNRTRSDSITDPAQLLGYQPTILIIAHKLNTIQQSDKIIVLDNGKVVSEGTHDQLITSCPYYVDLVKKQLNVLASTERHAKQPKIIRPKSFKSQSSNKIL
ncbi:ABC-type oligopeptide transporter ABCB9-like isoform X2 [Convolutriloba macropyga]|uniref:ABC-type oligopeptide transporter ABCB9-like isoform X2 n=1 Tax=Convolutriloba macropyga TaxID=536237 RepID=UPI003F51B745